MMIQEGIKGLGQEQEEEHDGSHDNPRSRLRMLKTLPAISPPSDILESSHISFLTAKWFHLPMLHQASPLILHYLLTEYNHTVCQRTMPELISIPDGPVQYSPLHLRACW